MVQRVSQNPAAVAKGVRYGTQKRICVAFDDETFDQLSALAQAEGISFAEVVRQACEWRLMEGA
jgi:hypothetical protein